VNLAIFTGNLGRDPELRIVNGDSVLGFSIGVQTGTKDKPGTMWVSCSIWGKRATSLEPYLQKGQRVTVSGSLRLLEYQGTDGTPKTQLRMTVDQLDLPPRGEGQPAAAAPQQRQQPSTGKGFDDFDDPIPF